MQPALADRTPPPSGHDDLDPRRKRDVVAALRHSDQALAREFLYARGASREDAQDAETPRRLFGRGWLFWFLLDVGLIVLPIPLVVMVPPVVSCRHIEKNVGFYAGDSFASCAQSGIYERWALLDSRIKMLIRQSGR